MSSSRKLSAPMVVEEVEADGYVAERVGEVIFAIRSRRKPKLRYRLGQGVQASSSNPDVKKGTLGWVTQIRLPNPTPYSKHCIWVIFEKQSIPLAYKLEHLAPQSKPTTA